MVPRRTGVVYDERCLGHVNPPGGVAFGTLPDWATVEAFERPERLRLTRDVLAGSGVLGAVVELAPRFAEEAELCLAHAPEHVRRVLDAAATMMLGVTLVLLGATAFVLRRAARTQGDSLGPALVEAG